MLKDISHKTGFIHLKGKLGRQNIDILRNRKIFWLNTSNCHNCLYRKQRLYRQQAIWIQIVLHNNTFIFFKTFKILAHKQNFYDQVTDVMGVCWGFLKCHVASPVFIIGDMREGGNLPGAEPERILWGGKAHSLQQSLGPGGALNPLVGVPGGEPPWKLWLLEHLKGLNELILDTDE